MIFQIEIIDGATYLIDAQDVDDAMERFCAWNDSREFKIETRIVRVEIVRGMFIGRGAPLK